jgi:hypothetical protein
MMRYLMWGQLNAEPHRDIPVYVRAAEGNVKDFCCDTMYPALDLPQFLGKMINYTL